MIRTDRKLLCHFARNLRISDQRCFWSWTSVDADADRPDHAAPFLNLDGNEDAELFRAHVERDKPYLEQAGSNLRLTEARGDIFVICVGNVGRNTRRTYEAKPCYGIETR